GVGNEIVIGVEKRGDVHEILILGQLASACSHIPTLPNPLRSAQLCPRSSCIVDGAEATSETSRLQQTPSPRRVLSPVVPSWCPRPPSCHRRAHRGRCRATNRCRRRTLRLRRRLGLPWGLDPRAHRGRLRSARASPRESANCLLPRSRNRR